MADPTATGTPREGPAARLLGTWGEVSSLRSEWRALLERSRADSLFLTWEWIEAWRAVVGDRVRPFVVEARDPDGRLIGVAPLYSTGLRVLGAAPCRALRVLGDHPTGADYGDWIVESGREAAAGAVLAGVLAAARRRWDCVWMPHVAQFTGARDRLTAACAATGLAVRERDMEFSAAALPPDFEAFWKGMSPNARSSIRRQGRKIDHLGLSFVRCTSVEELPRFLEALAELNHRRWSAEGLVGTFRSKPLELAFYRLFTREALSRGWLRFFGLRRGTEFMAVQIGYAYKGSFLQLQEGFDPAGPPGLGNVLRARVVEECIREGLASYDFLGYHTEHKRRWQAKVRRGSDLMITHGRPLSAALRLAGFWPTGRFLRPGRL
jgi:CelD/BcsL family acetyltransferase involved in cellulose biosynthesis